MQETSANPAAQTSSADAPVDAVHAHIAAGATAADCPFLAQAGLANLDFEMIAEVIAQVLGKSAEAESAPDTVASDN